MMKILCNHMLLSELIYKGGSVIFEEISFVLYFLRRHRSSHTQHAGLPFIFANNPTPPLIASHTGTQRNGGSGPHVLTSLNEYFRNVESALTRSPSE